MQQIDLFEEVALRGIHVKGTTQGLYSYARTHVTAQEMNLDREQDLGRWGQRNVLEHRLRAAQQRLKHKGLIQRGVIKGQWALTQKGTKKLTANHEGLRVGFVTSSGIAFWGDGKDLAKMFPNSVELIFCSPPYLLSNPRNYGNWGKTEDEYVENTVRAVESWLPLLTSTGSLCLNVGDHCVAGDGSVSMANERILLELRSRLGLKLMQKFFWHNPSKPPAGLATKRVRAKNTMEQVYWLSLNPGATKADNRRVLSPYSAGHQREIERARAANVGERKVRPSGHTQAPSVYRDNGGSIPSNLLQIAHESWQSEYSKSCRELDIPRHPAMAPINLASFFIKLITEPGEITADPCFGSGVTGKAAEDNGRLWIGAELHLESLQGASLRFH